jgi:hypothetical protein
MNGLQPTKITIFVLFWLVAIAVSATLGGLIGANLFGISGCVIGVILGFVLGNVLGQVPNRLALKYMLWDIAKSTNEELRRQICFPEWNFGNTMALLQLAARGEEVRTELPRILEMLESEEELKRVYGWDALRFVFDKECELIGDYDPRASADNCRAKVATLKDMLKSR